jgi:hypothetical protein
MFGERTMSTEIAVEQMSTAEKIALMERLWDDLSRRPEELPFPEWHGQVLAERIAAVREGRTDFVDGRDAKKRLNDRRNVPGNRSRVNRVQVYAVLGLRQDPVTIDQRLQSPRTDQ